MELKWDELMDIKNPEKFQEELRLFFVSKTCKTNIFENGIEWSAPFWLISPKYLLFLVDGGKILWTQSSDDKLLISFQLTLRRAFFLFVVLPLLLVLSMFIYNYFTQPYFVFNWIKGLVIICSPIVGFTLLKMKEEKIIRFFNDLALDHKSIK